MSVKTVSQNGFATKREGLQVVATFDEYAGAQAAVDRLSDKGFPVERLRVVGDGLSFVEDVTGRRDYGRAAREAAAYGACVAGFLGVLFGLLDWYDPGTSAFLLGLYGVVFGGLFGALTGLAVHWSTDGRRDFSSVASMTAARYQVLADAEVVDAARAQLVVSAARGSAT